MVNLPIFALVKITLQAVTAALAVLFFLFVMAPLIYGAFLALVPRQPKELRQVSICDIHLKQTILVINEMKQDEILFKPKVWDQEKLC